MKTIGIGLKCCLIIINELNEMIPGGNKLNSWLNSKRKVQFLKYRLRDK